ncbi:YveK family protein [Anaerocolumna xylanovorans]|nr:hypothetical protein [Anaerocolumna xylanovorans]
MNKINGSIKENFIELYRHLKKKIIRILLIATFTGTLICGINHFLLPDYYYAKAKFQVGMQVSNDYMILVKSQPFLEMVIYEAGVDMTAEELEKEVYLTVLKETRVMEIEISDYSPKRTRALIQAFVRVTEMEYGGIFGLKVVEDAGAEVPLPKRDAESFLRGFILGGIISLIVISIKYIRGSRIRKPEEIEKLLQLSVLAVLPAMVVNRQKRRRIRHED